MNLLTAVHILNAQKHRGDDAWQIVDEDWVQGSDRYDNLSAFEATAIAEAYQQAAVGPSVNLYYPNTPLGIGECHESKVSIVDRDGKTLFSLHGRDHDWLLRVAKALVQEVNK